MSDTSPPQSTPPSTPVWERELLEKLASASLVEQRRTRRWGIFFKFALAAYLLVLLAIYVPWPSFGSGLGKKHTALVEVAGVISADSQASADRVITGLRAAFEDKDTAGVVVRINSPGGSPVQAGYINDEIQRLRTMHPDTPLYAVITDICASGGYYVAVAAQDIYADKASIVGSIGVLSNGFGFVEVMEKVGVERRLLTAGEHKGFLDPFSPLKPAEVDHFGGMLKEIHQQFVEVVKSGRGERLKNDSQLFSGYVWSGEKSIELGLVDALGSASYVAREVIGAERIVDYTLSKSVLERVVERAGVSIGNVLLQQAVRLQ